MVSFDSMMIYVVDFKDGLEFFVMCEWMWVWWFYDYLCIDWDVLVCFLKIGIRMLVLFGDGFDLLVVLCIIIEIGDFLVFVDVIDDVFFGVLIEVIVNDGYFEVLM